MKKLFCILTFLFPVLIAMTIKANAQIPNSGFETWENYYDPIPPYNVYEKPDHWVGLLPKLPPDYTFSIEKNLESYPVGTGQYSMIIKNDLPNEVNGAAFSYDLIPQNLNPPPWTPSFPINFNPNFLCLYYKYAPVGGDSMHAFSYFFKNGIVIGDAAFISSQIVSNWTPLIIPVNHYNSEIPDSATIIFATYNIVQHDGSKLYVDNLSFDNLISVSEQSVKSTLFSLSPNPASDIVALNINYTSNEEFELKIFSVMGKLVKSGILKLNNMQLSIGDLNNGIYMVTIKSKYLAETKKLIIQR